MSHAVLIIRFVALAALCCVASCRGRRAEVARAAATGADEQVFAVRGVVREVKPEGSALVVRHEKIADYMEAMTMAFRVRDTNLLSGLQRGDAISFRLFVTENESWIDGIARTGRSFPTTARPVAPMTNAAPASVASGHPLLDYKFTNELGQAVSFNQFKGQAIAYTFFFTRCPIPEFCPRLMKNFQEASQKLLARSDAPTNWHFFSVSFDTEFDTPAVLKAYAERYHYDPRHWSFLTGPPDKIAELARQSEVNFERDGSLFTHGFRTLVIDAAGRLQMSYPIGGNLSDALVADIFKAAAATNQ